MVYDLSAGFLFAADSQSASFAKYRLPDRTLDADAPEAELTLDVPPNPIRGTGRITLHVAHAMHLTLTLFDLQGRRIATFPPTEVERGSYSLPIDATGLTPGVYLLRGEAEGEDLRVVRRIVVEK